MTPRLVDVHTHTQFSAYSEDQDTVIKRALGKGIWLINVGTQRNTSANSLELAHKYDGVFATVGLHPIHTEKSFHDSKELEAAPAVGRGEPRLDGFTSRRENFDYDYYKNLTQDKKVVAIGECGLDYYRLSAETKEKQAEVFIKQMELAYEVKKPLMIHCREAFHDLIQILNANRLTLNANNPGVIHFFSGTTDDAQKLMDMGFSFSFGGVITFTKDYLKAVKFIPLEKIVLETDAPYVTPVPYRGKRNEPLYVEEVAKKVARVRNIDFEEVAKVTTENAKRIFGL